MPSSTLMSKALFTIGHFMTATGADYWTLQLDITADKNSPTVCETLPDACVNVASEAECSGITKITYPYSPNGLVEDSYDYQGEVSTPAAGVGCFYDANLLASPPEIGFFWNTHPSGGNFGFVAFPICACTYTSAPTPAPPTLSGSMSGDPIVQVGGFRVKFDLPLARETLMWEDDTISLLARADVVTADKRSQWFSQFSLKVFGEVRAIIRPSHQHDGSKDELDAVHTLSIQILDPTGVATQIERTGYNHTWGQGKVRMSVKSLNRSVGGLRSEAFVVNSENFDFSIVAEVAKKFKSRADALKYEHLDITMQKMQPGVKAGVFAEIYGFVPMTADTAKMIHRVAKE